MIKQVIHISFVLFTGIILTACKGDKYEAELPEELSNKKWVRLSDEQQDGLFWLKPFDYYKNLLQSYFFRIDADEYDRKLALAKVEEVAPGEWVLGMLENWEVQDTFPLTIRRVDEARHIYLFNYHNPYLEKDPFSGYFIAVPPDFAPDFYPGDEHDTKYQRIIDHRFNINGVTTPAPVTHMGFYHARKKFVQQIGDYTAMEVEDVDTFIARQLMYYEKEGKCTTVADQSCDIAFPGMPGEYPHRYILTKIDVQGQIFDKYILHIFAKLSDRYSCILSRNFTTNKSFKVNFKLNCNGPFSEFASIPLVWDDTDTNASFWESGTTVDRKGGFSIFFTHTEPGNTYTNRNDYLYTVTVSENTLEAPLHWIPEVKWRLIRAAHGNEEIKILSDNDYWVLGSSEETSISPSAFYDEQLHQGLIEEEYDDYDGGEDW